MVKTDSLLLLAGPVEGGGLYCKSDSANNCVCVGDGKCSEQAIGIREVAIHLFSGH